MHDGEAYDIFTREYFRSTNIITPHVSGHEIVRRDDDGVLVVELSYGTGILGHPLYGATFVRERLDGTTQRLPHLSQVFESARRRREYIASLHRLTANEIMPGNS